MTKQLAVRIPDELADQLQHLVENGTYPTTAAAVRTALRQLVDRHRRRELDEAIVEGYRRVPPTPDEAAWAESAGRELIAEEPW